MIFQVWQILPSQVDAMTLEDYDVVKRHIDERLEEV